MSAATHVKGSPRNPGEASDFVGIVVDHSALKVNQTGIVATVLVAFAGSALFRPLLVLIPLLAIVLLVGTFAPQFALFAQRSLPCPAAVRHAACLTQDARPAVLLRLL